MRPNLSYDLSGLFQLPKVEKAFFELEKKLDLLAAEESIMNKYFWHFDVARWTNQVKWIGLPINKK